MGIGDSMFTIIFVMMGASAVVSGLNFEKKQGKNFKGENKQDYIKINKVILISMGGIILIGTFLAQGIPMFKDIITNITIASLFIVWIFYSVISKKRFGNKK
jgi:Ca2+/Na+ antiporter